MSEIKEIAIDTNTSEIIDFLLTLGYKESTYNDRKGTYTYVLLEDKRFFKSGVRCLGSTITKRFPAEQIEKFKQAIIERTK